MLFSFSRESYLARYSIWENQLVCAASRITHETADYHQTRCHYLAALDHALRLPANIAGFVRNGTDEPAMMPT